MQISGVGIAPAAIATQAAPFFSKLFGGDDINYANNFSSQVGTGKKYLQTEANAYYARGSRLGVSAQEIARQEYKAGRTLTDGEVLSLLGKAPPLPSLQPTGIPSAFPSAFPAAFPGQYQLPTRQETNWPLIISGGVAVLAIGAAILVASR